MASEIFFDLPKNARMGKAHIRETDCLVQQSMDIEKGIVCLIDWYSCVFEDQSINNVLTWIGIDPMIYGDEFIKNSYERSMGIDDCLVFSYNNVNIEVKNVLFYGMEQNEQLLDIVCPRIRLDISGKGLQFLRNERIDIDNFLRDESKLLDGQHITRCDFAFDFINYKGELLDQLIDYVKNNTTENQRVVICNMTSALKYKYRTGGEKTLYIGAATSDKMLRVYDKKMQYTDLGTGLYTKENPYNNPSTWIRIELQTRNKVAHQVCYGVGDFLSVLKYIYQYYCFADMSTPAHRRRPAEFWNALFNWAEIPALIQNTRYVSYEPYSEKVNRNVDRNIQSIILYIALHGVDGLFEKMQKYLVSMQFPEYDPDLQRKRWRSFLNKLAVLDLVEKCREPNSPLFIDEFNVMNIRNNGKGVKKND